MTSHNRITPFYSDDHHPNGPDKHWHFPHGDKTTPQAPIVKLWAHPGPDSQWEMRLWVPRSIPEEALQKICSSIDILASEHHIKFRGKNAGMFYFENDALCEDLIMSINAIHKETCTSIPTDEPKPVLYYPPNGDGIISIQHISATTNRDKPCRN